MTQSRDFVDDLLARARRGALSDDEQVELEQALSGSFEARLLLAAGQAFDAEGNVEAGDEELIARMVRRAERRVSPHRRSRARYFVQGALAGALLTGLAIAGVQELRSRLRASTPQHVLAPPPPTPAPRRLTVPVPDLLTPPAGVPSAIRDTAPLGTPSRVTARGKEESPGAAPVAPTAAQRAFEDAPAPAQSAAELFSAANRARVNGDVSRAIELYKQLEATFPQAAEASAAHLSLGVLYLRKKQPAAALAELRQRGGDSGASEAEALWIEASALRELGRGAEERATLERLVQRYPGSAYITAANRRLAELR